MFPLTRLQVTSRAVLKLLHLVLMVFSLSPSRLPRSILWIRLIVWIAWYVYICIRSLTVAQTMDCDLDCMLRHMLTVCQTASHSFLVVSTFIQGFRVSRKQPDELTIIFEASDPWVAFTVLGMLAPMIGVEYMVCSNVAGYERRVWLYHLKTLPSFLALQLQIVSFISEVMEVNIRVRLAKLQLVILARELSSRWPQCKYLPDSLDRQSYRIEALKRRYNELHLLYDRINDRFGGSLLIIIIVFFADFVCNSYWLFVDVRTTPKRRINAILVKMGFIFNVALQMSAACWHCQQSYNLVRTFSLSFNLCLIKGMCFQGRQIGCLISKLVKPQGSKRYNELVSEFSLQTLHQRFVVTAKDFFSLNLHLLSSMFAAVVTYLVILIQFMFAERSARGHSG
ncbi:hypothetical protein KR038_005745 [Drosophila bunnanda]|nr:hypothetical protein KR038_005745 [Drosophila bunnanda]